MAAGPGNAGSRKQELRVQSTHGLHTSSFCVFTHASRARHSPVADSGKTPEASGRALGAAQGPPSLSSVSCCSGLERTVLLHSSISVWQAVLHAVSRVSPHRAQASVKRHTEGCASTGDHEEDQIMTVMGKAVLQEAHKVTVFQWRPAKTLAVNGVCDRNQRGSEICNCFSSED